MPIEDASVEWPEELSPYVAVARIRVAAQPAWSEARAARGDDALSFAPWHGLAAHRPLGSINRARRPAYTKAAQFRSDYNGVSTGEPAAAVKLPRAPASAFGTKPGREGLRNARPQPGTSQGLSPVLAGATGGLAAGLVVSVLMLAKEAATAEANDLVQLERKLVSHPPEPAASATIEEQAAAHGGHLALSIAAGAVYGVLKPRDAAPVGAGLAFGMGFLALAYGGVGPAFGLTPPPWRDTTANNLQHLAVHAVFGVTIALVADRLLRRER